MRKITKKMIQESLTIISDFGIKITEIQFLSLMIYNENLRDDWSKTGSVDVVFREKILDAIAKDCRIKNCNGFWPTGMVHKTTRKDFEIEFKEKAPKRGYVIYNNFSII